MNKRRATGGSTPAKSAGRRAFKPPPPKAWQVEPEPPAQEGSSGEIVARPDGYHWIAPDGRQEVGPFETLELAQSYRDAYDEGAPGPVETLQEAGSEIGMSDWIDPETGAPAEGPCPPHLDDE